MTDMKVVSRILSTIAVLLRLVGAPMFISVQPACADGGIFACVVTEDCYLYPTADLNEGLFLLPKTYYVNVLENLDNAYRVSYLVDGKDTRKIIGYCRKEKVSVVDYQPTNPYLFACFDVTYQTEGESGDGFLTQITFACAYYGDYYVGSIAYCYVLRDNAFGYVPKPASFVYDENPEFFERQPPPATQEEKQTFPTYLLFIALALLTPAAVYLLFKFAAKKPFDEDVDE